LQDGTVRTRVRPVALRDEGHAVVLITPFYDPPGLLLSPTWMNPAVGAVLMEYKAWLRCAKGGGVARGVGVGCAQLPCFCAWVVMAGSRPEPQDHPPENGFSPLERPAPRLLPHIDGCVLPSLGGFGRHQKQLVVLTWIPALFIGFSQFSDHFLLAQPNGTCVLPAGNLSSWTGSPLLATGSPAPHLGANGTAEGLGDGAGLLCACEERRLELQTGLLQNVVTKLFAASLSPFPRFGRHPVLILSALFMLVFGLSVAFSVNVTMFSTLRFFEGFCLAGLALSLYVLSKYKLLPPACCLPALLLLSVCPGLCFHQV
ncbi:hypothetical protein GOODEAATRI_025391, partial [Goodea atripinnis]